MTKTPDVSMELSHHIPSSTSRLTIDGAVLVGLLAHAASAARLVGHLDDAIACGPLADHVDAMVQVLSELLGAPCAIAASVRSAHSSFATEATPMASGAAGGVR
jgi:hypothetical protein